MVASSEKILRDVREWIERGNVLMRSLTALLARNGAGEPETAVVSPSTLAVRTFDEAGSVDSGLSWSFNEASGAADTKLMQLQDAADPDILQELSPASGDWQEHYVVVPDGTTEVWARFELQYASRSTASARTRLMTVLDPGVGHRLSVYADGDDLEVSDNDALSDTAAGVIAPSNTWRRIDVQLTSTENAGNGIARVFLDGSTTPACEITTHSRSIEGNRLQFGPYSFGANVTVRIGAMSLFSGDPRGFFSFHTEGWPDQAPFSEIVDPVTAIQLSPASPSVTDGTQSGSVLGTLSTVGGEQTPSGTWSLTGDLASIAQIVENELRASAELTTADDGTTGTIDYTPPSGVDGDPSPISVTLAVTQTANWSQAPAGYNRVFFDDFAAPVTGTVNGFQSWQGIDRSKWTVADAETGNPDGSGANATKWPFRSPLAEVKPGGKLWMYGGRNPSKSDTDNTIEETQRALCSVSMRQNLFWPSNPAMIMRHYGPWEQRYGYSHQPWLFGRRRRISANNQAHDIGWEIDIETQGSEYDHANRTWVPHFNFHQWQWHNGFRKSQKNPRKTRMTLPWDPSESICIELRWARGSDFYDPYQTYCEYWIEERGGDKVCAYHHSPRNFLEEHRDDNRVWPNGRPASKQALPPELASVAGKPKINPNPHTTWPYNEYTNMYVPWLYYDAGWDWGKHMEETWVKATSSGLVWWTGFSRDAFFLSDSGTFNVGDYSDHYSHVDDNKCFACPVNGVAVFDPD
ncbi:MAG: hypothetical protein GVY35_14070 [Bacteroidetes bacterium]|nr:hypothetical protein [Bacteroidota bacterium]